MSSLLISLGYELTYVPLLFSNRNSIVHSSTNAQHYVNFSSYQLRALTLLEPRRDTASLEATLAAVINFVRAADRGNS